MFSRHWYALDAYKHLLSKICEVLPMYCDAVPMLNVNIERVRLWRLAWLSLWRNRRVIRADLKGSKIFHDQLLLVTEWWNICWSMFQEALIYTRWILFQWKRLLFQGSDRLCKRKKYNRKVILVNSKRSW